MKATKRIVERRVEEVLRIRLDGAEAWDIRQYVAEKAAAGDEPWRAPEGAKPLSERQIRRYVRKADALIEASCRTSRKKLLRRHLAQRRNLYARAVNAGDYRTALAVLTDLAKLEGLYPSPEEQLRREVEALKRLLAEAEARRDGPDYGPPGGNDTARGTALPS